MHMPCEKAIRHCKEQLNVSGGTHTASFVLAGRVGAYVTDPVRLVKALRGNPLTNGDEDQPTRRNFLCVGGDKGGDFTKLGVIYFNSTNKAHFQALVVYQGDDKFETMKLLHEGVLTFQGDSLASPHIFTILQALLDEGAFLTGDWPFLAACLALKGAASNYPCPICLVPKQHLGKLSTPRDPWSQSAVQHAGTIAGANLLSVRADYIVPTPLHVFLGIGDRIIDKVLVPTFTKETIAAAIAAVKSKHAPGFGGLSDIYGLNGAELTRFIKTEVITKLISSTPSLSNEQRARLKTLHLYLRCLERFILKSAYWHPEEVFIFDELCTNIVQHWAGVTEDHLFPKLHMLLHCAQFASRWHFLGKASEAPIEATHPEINRLYNFNHCNKANDPATRIQRSLSDHVYRSATRTALGDITNLVALPPARRHSA